MGWDGVNYGQFKGKSNPILKSKNYPISSLFGDRSLNRIEYCFFNFSPLSYLFGNLSLFNSRLNLLVELSNSISWSGINTTDVYISKLLLLTYILTFFLNEEEGFISFIEKRLFPSFAVPQVSLLVEV
jgi:hypothetical protein